MGLHVRRIAWLAFVLAAAVPAPAQIASSSNLHCTAYGVDGAGGGQSSLTMAAHAALGEVSGGPLVSDRYTAIVGFLGGSDPQVTNLPVVFGINPPFGPKAGGTAISIGGHNFDKFGSGPTVEVTVGGTPVDNLVVQSDSLITATMPAGPAGAHDVEVSNSIGATTEPEGFVYTPAILTTPVVPMGGVLKIRNYGPVGDYYWTVVSLTTMSKPTKFGLLLVGPTIFELLTPTPYPPSDGVSTVTIHVPNDPALQGLDVHFQSLSVTAFKPVEGELTNATTTSIP